MGTLANLFVCHLPALSDARASRVTYVGTFQDWAATFATPRLVGGDFNDKPGTSPIVAMTQQYSDAWAAGGSGYGYTHPATTPTSRIDYWFSDANGAAKLLSVTACSPQEPDQVRAQSRHIRRGDLAGERLVGQLPRGVLEIACPTCLARSSWSDTTELRAVSYHRVSFAKAVTPSTRRHPRPSLMVPTLPGDAAHFSRRVTDPFATFSLPAHATTSLFLLYADLLQMPSGIRRPCSASELRQSQSRKALIRSVSMVTISLRRSLPVIAIAAATAIACGSRTSSSPVAPTANTDATIPAPAPSLTGTATIAGTIAGSNAAASVRSLGPFHPTSGAVTVSIVGSSATSTIDPSGRFTLTGVPTGDVELQFSGPGANAQLTIGGVNDHELIQITVTLSGGSASADSTERTTPDNHVQLEGRVSAINFGNRSFTLLDSTVLTGTDTRIWDGARTLQLSDLQINDRVHVSGTKTGATTVTAAEVIFQTAKPMLPPAEVNGVVSGLAGTCPTVTFTADATKIFVDSSTQFAGGSCAQLVNGTTAHVEGSRQTDGSVKAARIEVQRASASPPEHLSGTIARLSGTCPAITFILDATKVTTNTSTEFANVSCSTLANGTTVNVQGTTQSDNSVVASRVEKTGR